MSQNDLDQRLSQIQTVWTMLQQAHAGGSDEAQAALQLLILRYGGAVKRYLHRLVGNADAAEELSQEFALSLLRGDFAKADPARGRFRNYVKTAIYHLACQHREKAKRLHVQLDAANPVWTELAASESSSSHSESFNESWRDELLHRAMDELKQANATMYAVMVLRIEAADKPLTELAEVYSQRQGRPISADSLRQTLHRARLKFADLVYDLVARSLHTPTKEDVLAELADLGLLEACRPLLDKP